MQEEVENRTVNLVVSTTKLTARSLIRGLRWYLMSRNQKRMRKAMAHEEGKQSVKELLKAGVGTDKIELPDGSAKDFCKLAKKFGVDYAIRKDKSQDADTIVGNMDSQIFLGGSEPTTLKDLSQALGKETIDTYNTGETRGREQSHLLLL